MKFSVITVVKNELSKIALTLQSLKNQTFKDYEHVVFDGNSTDGTTEFLKKNLDNQNLYFRESDKGVYDAINKSFNKAKGQYFIILHAGDFFYSKNSLYELSEFINSNNNYDFYHSNILFYNNTKMNVSRVWKIASKSGEKFNFLKIAHTSLCIKNKISKKIFYNDEIKISADIDYLYNLCNQYKGKYFDNFFIYMEDQGLSSSGKFFLIKLKEDFMIHYRLFNMFFLFVMIYKILIKIPGILTSKKKYDNNFINEKNKLL
tara:strand:+ start:2437 stop:3219 length:783 start_codon:yes stop_codon:yes gene_type:complete